MRMRPTEPAEIPPEPAGPREKFDWLRDDRLHRRGNLQAVRAAIRASQVSPGDAPALVAILTELFDDATTTPRESMRLCEVLLAMTQANLATATARRYLEQVQAGCRPRGRPPGS